MPPDVNGTKVEMHVVIRPLDRAGAGAAAQDGGSDGTVVAALPVDSVQLEFSSRTGADGNRVISLTGELDIATAGQAYAYLSEVIGTGDAPISVDLAGLAFCDASGLGVLARIARSARQAGRQLRLTSARPSLVKIMRITGLDRAFPELRPATRVLSMPRARVAACPRHRPWEPLPQGEANVTMEDGGFWS